MRLQSLDPERVGYAFSNFQNISTWHNASTI